MKIPISELLEDCFDDQIHFQEDEALDQNWKEHILEQIRQHAELQRKHRFTKYLLTGLAAAAMVGTAFASGIFVMHKQTAMPGETEKHNEVFLVDDQTGETETEEVVLRDVAVSFTFTGEDTPNEVWVHPDYLPKEPEQLNPDLMIEGEPGWYQYLSGESGYADMNALHPFREGNGRAQREFARELCLQCGYVFDLTRTTHDEMLQASIDSFNQGDNSGFVSIFSHCIIPVDEYADYQSRLTEELLILSRDDLP